MTNLQKRILTSFIILPSSIFFVVKGGYFLLFFLIFVLFGGMHELISVFKNRPIILFLGLTLILSLFSIYYLKTDNIVSTTLLYLVITICIGSDIGGYVFGKIFKWKKLTKISPKKTISGVFGSFFFSLIWLVIANEILYSYMNPEAWKKWIDFLSIKYLLFTIIFSMIAQAGDLTISYFKRIEKIKDTGKILPGHGGIFDRVDGLMFVVILTFFLYFIKIIP